MNKPNKKTLQKKCDKLLQEIGRKTYDKCLVCGKPMDCLHHYISKGRSNFLRYNWKNLIPICTSCHCKIETAKAHEITGRITLIKGKKWLEWLENNKNTYVKTDIAYYKNIYDQLSKIN